MYIVKNFFYLSLTAALTTALVVFLQRPLFHWPALGKLINPTTGLWASAGSGSGTLPSGLRLALHDTAQVSYDSDRVPHVFARNDHDLYYLQGYLTARDRLFQMELQARKAEGSLSEVMGRATVSGDRYYRRLGMADAATASLALMEKDPPVREMLQAYADGVNAYIASLRPADLPVEYKLMDFQPRSWQPVYSVLIMKLMAETLTAGSEDPEMTRVLRRFGSDTTNFLFPDFPWKEAPVFAEPGRWPHPTVGIPPARSPMIVNSGSEADHPAGNDGVGSNNWVVGAGRSQTGFPLLANDPHLRLTLPSIWYQVQLKGPDQNVYGVSIPGVPAVIIGFNEKIAWGVTNTYADVTDWYQVRYRDASAREYWCDGAWVPTRRRIEVIRVKGEPPVTDTTILTRYGPIIPEKTGSPQQGLAMKWLGAAATEELASFYHLDRAANFSDFRRALATFTVPAQTFVYADGDKHIAAIAAGKFPLKYRDQGKFVLDGSDTANDWQGWVPEEGRPVAFDPPSDYVFSANESLTDSTYPYYLNWHFSPSERARRIRARLETMSNATADSMRDLQTDTYSVFAADALPYFLSVLHSRKLSEQETGVLQLLEHWDYRFEQGSMAATFFNAWWGGLYDEFWAPYFAGPTGLLKRPSRDRTLQLMVSQPSSRWFDDPQTATVETAADLITRSFQSVTKNTIAHLGPPGEKWEWGRNKVTMIGHIAGLQRFGTGFFGTPGTASTVNALSRDFGPSWRMVVELGPAPKAYGILPGGASGDPGSVYYDNQLHDWQAGRLHRLVFWHSVAETAGHSTEIIPLH